jgi:hypothetical protein
LRLDAKILGGLCLMITGLACREYFHYLVARNWVLGTADIFDFGPASFENKCVFDCWTQATDSAAIIGWVGYLLLLCGSISLTWTAYRTVHK